ncbi:hypothetical protein [Ramlibacter alkalitolerans]|uniref:hypothetical protein n=1 Tax=Ramlibacter alkalitolerans TaxID=2039631 RepID=UPI001F30C414|nr:hypothetical protein [Ramlibacter alkalitolerans]
MGRARRLPALGHDENGLLWRGARARYVFERRLATPPGTRFNDNGGLTSVPGLLLEAAVETRATRR